MQESIIKMKFFELDKITDIHHKSKSLWNPLPSFPVYGGQIVAQATKAAYADISENFHVHSLHTYFLNPADILKIIEYKVITLHSGRSFITKKVEAFQNNILISIMEISFTKQFGGHLTFQSDSLKVYEDTYTNIMKIIGKTFIKDPNLSDEEHEKKIKIILDHIDYLGSMIKIELGKPFQNKRQIKFTLTDKIEDEQTRACFIAFMSDFLLMEPALLVLNENLFGNNIKIFASINHALNFHGNNFDKELIFQVECLRILDSRVFCVGHLFNEKNELIATATQEGLIRIKK